MARKQKPFEEQLAAARIRKEKANARYEVLSVKLKQRENRLRGQGEKTLLRVLLKHIQADAGFRSQVELLVDKATLRPDERKAIGWMMSTLVAANAPGKPPASDAQQQVA